MIFAVQPIHFVWGGFVFAPTVLYIVHLLKVHCLSVSLGELCNWNMWIVPPLLYSKVKAIFAVCLYILP